MYHNRFGLSWPKVRTFFEAVRTNEATSLPIGAAGFCWGGQHTVVMACGEHSIGDKPLLDVAFTGHPSGISIPGDFEQVKIPLSVAIGDEDDVVSMAKIKQIQGVLKNLEDVESEVVIYRGAGHGFCVRADPKHETAKQAIDAEEQAIGWFSKHFDIAGY
jgi:dienelactone hydrolase